MRASFPDKYTIMKYKQWIPWYIFGCCFAIIISVLLNVIYLSEPGFSVNRNQATSFVLIAQSFAILSCIVLNLSSKEGSLLDRGSFYVKNIQGKFLLMYDVFILGGFFSSIVLAYLSNNNNDWTRYNIAASFLIGIRAGILFYSALINFDGSMTIEEQTRLTQELQNNEPLLTTEMFSIGGISDIQDEEETILQTSLISEPETNHEQTPLPDKNESTNDPEFKIE